jgi:hypothetical protein
MGMDADGWVLQRSRMMHEFSVGKRRRGLRGLDKCGNVKGCMMSNGGCGRAGRT